MAEKRVTGDSPAAVAYQLVLDFRSTAIGFAQDEASILDTFAGFLRLIHEERAKFADSEYLPPLGTNGTAEVIAWALLHLIGGHAGTMLDIFGLYPRCLVAALGQRRIENKGGK